MEGFIGFIMAFAGNYAPKFWLFCQGQLLPIKQYDSLYSILGTTYGGDGRINFALPDLRGRLAVGSKQGPGLSNYNPGDKGGAEALTLSLGEMPAHKHQPLAYAESADTTRPNDSIWAKEGTGTTAFYTKAAPDGVMSKTALATTGGNKPHDNMQPYLATNYIICVEGWYPARW